jgi:hypothetical protein
LALPWLVIVACEAYYGSSAEIAKFPHQLFAEGYNYFSVGLMNALPFVPGGVIVQWAANRRREGTAAAAHTMAAAVMAVAALALSLWGQFSVWRSTFNPGSHSSTAAIGLYVLVILGFALVPVSYLAGWLAGKIVFSDPASWKLLRRPELMTEDNANKARKAFWVVALIGFLLPWIVIICCQIYVGIAAEIRNFPAHLFESGYNFFFLAVMNATPFVIVAVAARAAEGKTGKTHPARPVGWAWHVGRLRHDSEFVCADRGLEQRVQTQNARFARGPGYLHRVLGGFGGVAHWLPVGLGGWDKCSTFWITDLLSA